MDNTALTLCMDNGLPIIVFDMNVPGNIRRVVNGEPIGTFVGRPSSSTEYTRMLNDVFKDTESRMGKAVDATRSEFAGIRTGRASPALLDRIQVEAYGATVPLKQVASISSPTAVRW